jgi:endonuclease III
MEDLILKLSKERFNEPKCGVIHFVDDREANRQLNDLTHHPHAFVLACLMDRQIPAERAWNIPGKVFSLVGGSDMKTLGAVKESHYIKLFTRAKLHRFSSKMASVFYNAIKRIKDEYQGNAALIWSGTPSSATVVGRFCGFDGCGVKIATMAANLLARKYKIPFSDYRAIDISPDVHVVRVMQRLGYVSRGADRMEVIYKARELYPDYPGIIDGLLWEVGRQYCSPATPDCTHCIIGKACKKVY